MPVTRLIYSFYSVYIQYSCTTFIHDSNFYRKSQKESKAFNKDVPTTQTYVDAEVPPDQPPEVMVNPYLPGTTITRSGRGSKPSGRLNLQLRKRDVVVVASGVGDRHMCICTCEFLCTRVEQHQVLHVYCIQYGLC